jgi:DNA-binding HxlR family transcriptional regulator
MDKRTDTHDMSFIIQPALRMDWELTGNAESLKNVITAAESLATRYNERVGAIRSWDRAVNHRYSYTDMEKDFLVIIDSMCSTPHPSKL